MPDHGFVVEVPAMRREDREGGAVVFSAGDDRCRFEATLLPGGDLVLIANYERYGDGGTGSYHIQGEEHLTRVLGELLLYVAGMKSPHHLCSVAAASLGRDGPGFALPRPTSPSLWHEREEAGLSSYGQVGSLVRDCGVTWDQAMAMTRDQAAEAIDSLSGRRRRKPRKYAAASPPRKPSRGYDPVAAAFKFADDSRRDADRD